MTLRPLLLAVHRLLGKLLEPPVPVEKPLSDKDREALAKLALKLERDGKRRGSTAWNYFRPRRAEGNENLRYMIDSYGVKGTVDRLAKAASERNSTKDP